MKMVYIAGPFTASDSWTREQNIRRVEKLMAQLLYSGLEYLPICTHPFGRLWHGEQFEFRMLSLGLDLVRRCDAVLLTHGWEFSRGTREEVTVAGYHQKPIYVSVEALHYGAPTPTATLLTKFQIREEAFPLAPSGLGPRTPEVAAETTAPSQPEGEEGPL